DAAGGAGQGDSGFDAAPGDVEADRVARVQRHSVRAELAEADGGLSGGVGGGRRSGLEAVQAVVAGALKQAALGCAGVVEGGLGGIDVDGAQRDGAVGGADEGGDDLLDAVSGDVEPVAAGEGGRLGIGLQVVLKLLDLRLDLRLVDVRLGSRDQ